jgi:hypothetical protein
MKLGAASRQSVLGKGLSLQMIEECLAVSTASVARTVRFQIISDQYIL